MEYKILDNGTAVLLTRQPEPIKDELCVTFTGVPTGATAIFEVGDTAIYRLLEEDSCVVPVYKLVGEVKVTVVILDGSARPQKWICEELKGHRLESGEILVAPNDMNLPQRYVELKLENQILRDNDKELHARLDELREKLEKLYEGYDIV